MHLFSGERKSRILFARPSVPREDGSFQLKVKLPYGGMYRLLADFYPAGSVPQLAVARCLWRAAAEPAKLSAALAPARSPT